MKVLVVYARLYADCLRHALVGIGKNAWTLLLPVLLLAAFFILTMLLSPLGIIGGFILALVLDALGSCYLYFVGEVVANTKATVSEFRKSVGAYFWSVMNLLFVLWVASWVLRAATQRNPEGGYLRFVFWFASFVLLNAAPEVIYQKGTYGGIATIQRTVQFIQANWIEWFLPNLLLGAGVYVALGAVPLVTFVGQLGTAIIGGALLHLIMVFRGRLFEVLDSSSHRQRMFRYRTGA